MILVFALGLSVAVGSVSIPVSDIFRLFTKTITRQPLSDTFQTYATIVFQLRLPRTVLMAIVGAAQAGPGASYQGLFRKPLAGPVPDRRGIRCGLGA